MNSIFENLPEKAKERLEKKDQPEWIKQRWRISRMIGFQIRNGSML
ncbi:hypothetical protein [Methanooceanicella nereidis]|nr:hypothetical protein [Methanocella sp. CWC-04]